MSMDPYTLLPTTPLTDSILMTASLITITPTELTGNRNKSTSMLMETFTILSIRASQVVTGLLRIKTSSSFSTLLLAVTGQVALMEALISPLSMSSIMSESSKLIGRLLLKRLLSLAEEQ